MDEHELVVAVKNLALELGRTPTRREFESNVKGGVVFRKIRGQTLWELNAGYMADPHAKGLTYTPQRITHWTEGLGWTDEYGPRFIPG